MRFLLVDDSRDFRGAVAGMLRARWPSATIEEWAPCERGMPDQALPAATYAAVLLYVEPDAAEALRWMTEVVRVPDAPPVVLLTETGGETLAVAGMKAGAADFLQGGECRFAVVEHALERTFARRAEAIGLRYVQASRFNGYSLGSGGRVSFMVYRSHGNR